MWRVLIVEDEDWTRMGLEASMDWRGMGASLLPSARDGVEALERIGEEKPDLVLTDIRMPDMDGLRLLEYLHAHMPEVAVIIISGYNEFEYAQRAMRLGALGYVLKPIEEDALHAEIERCFAQLDRASVDRQRLRASMPILRERAVRRWLKGELSGDFADTLRFAGLEPPKGRIRTALVHIDWLVSTLAEEEARELVRIGVARRMEHLMGALVPISAEDRGELAVVLPDMDDNALEALLISLCRETKARLGFSLTVGVGRAVDCARACESLAGARRALERRRYQGCDAVYFDGAAEECVRIDDNLPEAYRMLAAAAQAGDAREARERVRVIAQALAQSGVDREAALRAMIRTGLILYASEPSVGLSPADADRPSRVLARLSGAQSVQQMAEELLNDLPDGAQGLAAGECIIVTECRRYLEEHISDEGLSLNSLSQAMHVSPAYLCRAFGNAQRESVTQYIMRRRVESARAYLLDARLSIGEVGERVGYPNAQYFSRVFKRLCGITPGQYRQNAKR